MQGGAFRRKLVIVGDGACGKTSLLSVFAMGEFPREYTPTIFEASAALPSAGNDTLTNYVAEIRLDGKAVQLALWDTAGQEEYERLRPLSYSKSHVILIAFALDTPDSLENVTVKWIEEVRELCGPNIPVLLVGLKSDLRDQAMQQGGGERGRFVTTEQGQQTATQIGARAYHECSALLNAGVDETFEAATRAAMLVRGAGAGASSSHGHGHGEDDGAKERDRRRRDKEDGGGGCGCVIL
ncbi:Rho GTPase [Rhodotorula kratochvilovae]